MQPFTPHKLSLENLDWESYISLIGSARDKLSKFDGLLQGIPNPSVLLSPLTTQEAVISSKIEGTQATMEEVLEYEADPTASKAKKSDIKEILNYREAMYHAVSRIDELQLTVKLIKELHKILLTDVRSSTGVLGEFRQWQVYIGKEGTSIEEANFVPPAAQDVPEHMSELERYIHTDEKDPLVQLAIVHAQFEIIHPFGDGNGRVGRMILPLFLQYKDLLQTPMFYLSAYFEKDRDSYYLHLQNISKNNDWDSWIKYFLTAVKEQSEVNIEKTKSILNLYNQKKKEIQKITNSKYSLDLLDFIFSYPYFSTPQLSQKSNIKPSYAKDLIKKLEGAGLIREFSKGIGRRPNIYVFTELVDITG